MNICLISHEYPPESARGGIGTQTWHKAQALARLGHTVHVLACAGRGTPETLAETDPRITVHRMPGPGEAPGDEFPVYDAAVYWFGYTWSVLRELERLSQKTQFDLMNFPEYGAEGFAYQLNRTRWNWVPVVVQLHGPLALFAERIGWPEPGSQLHRLGTFMEEVSIKLADGLMASSANIADFVAARYGVARKSIDVVHCGVDCDTFRPPRGDEPTADRPTVLYVGNVASNKGIRTVLEAVLRLRARYPDIRLQILGQGDEDLVRELRARARDRAAERNVEFHGFLDRALLPRFYRPAQVFCSPAQYELGVANVYVEAMACGCPVVASTSGGAPEAVVHGETGLLVPPNDVEATAAALERILGDPALRARMSAAGRRHVEDYFAVEKYIGRVLAAYEKAIERSRQTLARLAAETQ